MKKEEILKGLNAAYRQLKEVVDAMTVAMKELSKAIFKYVWRDWMRGDELFQITGWNSAYMIGPKGMYHIRFCGMPWIFKGGIGRRDISRYIP